MEDESWHQKKLMDYFKEKSWACNAIMNDMPLPWFKMSKKLAGIAKRMISSHQNKIGFTRGMPDLIVCIPKLGVVHIEMKLPRKLLASGKLSSDKKYSARPEQQLWIDNINSCGGIAFVANGYHDGINKINNLLDELVN